MNRDYKKLSWEHTPVEEYDLVRHFVELNNKFPNNMLFLSNDVNGYISYDLVKNKLLENNAEVLFKSSVNKSGIRKEFLLLDNTFILLEGIYAKNMDVFDNLPSEINEKDKFHVIGQITILYPSEDIDKKIVDIIDDYTFKPIYFPTVGIISRDNSGFYLNEILLEATICKDLELHYGEGFDKFHEKLMKRLITTNKGISLFHGIHGSGKTTYINRLILDLKEQSNKKIILVPTNMVSYLLEPDFNTFLIDLVNDSKYDNEEIDLLESTEDNSNVANGIIFIIEDAEPVLLKREENNNSQSTSNILNLTDGLLNSIFKIQIIATYNTDDSNIDAAIFRDKRLIAKREMKELSMIDAKKLASTLNIDESLITKEMTLASIYALIDNEDDVILIDDKREIETKKKAGLKLI